MYPEYVPLDARAAIEEILQHYRDAILKFAPIFEAQIVEQDDIRCARCWEGQDQRSMPADEKNTPASKYQFDSRLTRIALDERMYDVYSLLSSQLNRPGWDTFIGAAAQLELDYSEIRAKSREARELSKRAAVQLSELAGTIRALRRIKVRLPKQLRDPTVVERGVDITSENDFSLGLQVLEDAREVAGQPDFVDQLIAAKKNLEAMQDQYFDDVNNAAIRTRQSNWKTDTIRAFAQSLSNGNVSLNTDVRRAIAITITVLSDDPDVDITIADVASALTNHASSHARSIEDPSPRRKTRRAIRS